MNSAQPGSLEQNFGAIEARIEAACAAAGRKRSSVTLLAVSKTQPADAIEALYKLGQRDFGENYVQEVLEKAPELERRGCTGIRWHFIGHLQSNKVKQLVPFAHAIHSVDSEKLAREISKRVTKPLPIFLEVNIDSEADKAGVAPAGVPELFLGARALPHLLVQGLMCIPDPELGDTSIAFKRLATMAQGLGVSDLSMGMTSDFESAIACGATHIRIGTALFGKRSPPP